MQQVHFSPNADIRL